MNVETPTYGEKWYAIILRREESIVYVKCVNDWNKFLIQCSYVDDWYVQNEMHRSKINTIDLKDIGNVTLNHIIPGNGLIIYPTCNPRDPNVNQLQMFTEPLFLVRPMISTNYDVNKFVYKYIGSNLIKREEYRNQSDIDKAICEASEQYSWLCQFENLLGLELSNSQTANLRPHQNGWVPREGEYKAFLSKWYNNVLDVQASVWGVTMDWGRGAWYNIKTMQTKPWKVPVNKKYLVKHANYYGLEITETCDILHTFAIKFQSNYQYGHSYILLDILKSINDDAANLIKNNSNETDLVIIEKENMPPVVTWKHCKVWHDLTINFFGTKNDTQAQESSDTDSNVDEFSLIERLKSSDGVILQGPAGSGKSTLLAKLSNAIKAAGSAAISMAYTGKAAKVIKNKGINSLTIHSFLHMQSSAIFETYWSKANSKDNKSKRNYDLCHELTDKYLVSTNCKQYMNYEEFKKVKIADSDYRNYAMDNVQKIINYQDILSNYYIIVDEASMLGARMMFILLTKIGTLSKVIPKDKTIKLILIGDKEQLPPVKDLNIFEMLQSICTTFYLTKIHRIGESGPLFLSQKCIKEGISTDDLERSIDMDKNMQLSNFAIKDLHPYKEYMKNHDRIFISPYKKIVNDINNIITDGRSDHLANKWRVGDKVIVTSNLKTTDGVDLVNGDMGTILSLTLTCEELVTMRPSLNYLKKKNHPSREMHCIFLYIHGDKTGAVLYTSREKSIISFAYCVTIHKSQGSEWKKVFICLNGLDKVTSFLNRKMLYTAITRTKKGLVLVGHSKIIKDMSENKLQLPRSLLNYYNGIIAVTKYKVKEDNKFSFGEEFYEPEPDIAAIDDYEFDF